MTTVNPVQLTEGLASTPTAAGSLGPTRTVLSPRRIAALIAIAATVMTFAPTAKAAVQFSDGSASAGVTCPNVFGGGQAWTSTVKTTSRSVWVTFYVYAANNPSASAWMQTWIPMQVGYVTIGNIANRGFGPVAVMARYGWYNGSQWQTTDEWLVFGNTGSYYCFV